MQIKTKPNKISECSHWIGTPITSVVRKGTTVLSHTAVRNVKCCSPVEKQCDCLLKQWTWTYCTAYLPLNVHQERESHSYWDLCTTVHSSLACDGSQTGSSDVKREECLHKYWCIRTSEDWWMNQWYMEQPGGGSKGFCSVTRPDQLLSHPCSPRKNIYDSMCAKFWKMKLSPGDRKRNPGCLGIRER